MTDHANSTGDNAPKDFGWALLELMGHRKRIGRVREEEIAGSLMLRVDIRIEDEDYVTEYYGADAIYSLRPVSEDIALAHYAARDPRPARPVDYKPAAEPEQLTYEDDSEDEDF